MKVHTSRLPTRYLESCLLGLHVEVLQALGSRLARADDFSNNNDGPWLKHSMTHPTCPESRVIDPAYVSENSFLEGLR